MTQQPDASGECAPSPSLLAMSGPLVISFWMRAAFSLVDTAYAAQLGDSAVAAIGLTLPFEFLMIALWVGVSNGFTSCLSRAMGQRENRMVEQYKAATRTIVLALSPVFLAMGVAVWFGAPYLDLDKDVAREFQIYGSILLGGSAFTSFWSVLPDSVIKAHQDTRTTMWAGIFSNLLNVSLNTVFVFVFEWGVFGIALSTVIGRLAGLGYALMKARQHELRRLANVSNGKTNTDPGPIRRVLRLAVPSGFSFALITAETGIINGALSSLENSTEAIAAYSIYYRVSLFMMNPVIAVGVAMLPFAARHLGRRDFEGVRQGVRTAHLATIAYCVAITPVTYFSANMVASWLGESPLTVEYAAFGLTLVPLSVIAGAPFMLCRPAFEAMERGMPGLITAAVRSIALTFPAVWLAIRLAEPLGTDVVRLVYWNLIAVAAIASGGLFFWFWSTLGRESAKAASEA